MSNAISSVLSVDTDSPGIRTISPELEMESGLSGVDEIYAEEFGFNLLDSWKYRETVRQKYGLPECAYLFEDPVRYIREITDLCAREGIILRHKDEFDSFFKENPLAEAVNLGKNVFRDATLVVRRASSDDWFALRAKAKQLSHEVVHAMQEKKYPRMSDEESEREAYYYQMLTPRTIERYREDPKFMYYWVGTIIEKCVRDSVETDEKINGKSNADNSTASNVSTSGL